MDSYLPGLCEANPMIFAALDEAAQRGELILVDGGLCRFHQRRDGIVTIREIVVLPETRRKGTGRAMVREVIRRYPDAVLSARCPQHYPANEFWRAIGFEKVSVDLARSAWINTWQFRPSSTAPTATQPTPALR